MLKYLFIIASIFVFAKNSFGQKIIYGRVSDGVTQKSLPSVNVFVNNTTLGTATNKDGTYRLFIPSDEFEVVFSFVGYQSIKMKNLNEAKDTVRINVELFPSSQELEGVVVNSSTDKEWEKLIKQFQKVFFGDTYAADYCTILNSWCIDLKMEKISGKQILSAKASQPLEIVNLSLGYKIYYELQDFSSSREGDAFTGNVYFVDLEPKNSEQAEAWRMNRLYAYQGSSRHLFKSILDQRYIEEGFKLFVYNSSESKQVQFQRLDDYSPSNIQFDTLSRKYIIPIEENIEIHFRGTIDSNKDLLAGMHIKNKMVDVDHNGVVYDPLSVITSGYLSNLRVANLLPNDYLPVNEADLSNYRAFITSEKKYKGRKKNVLTVDQIIRVDSTRIKTLAKLDSLENQALRYLKNSFEKVYVHFDKPFYCLGEDSWYKAYVVRGSDLSPTDISSLLYLDWIDPSGKVIKHEQLKIENGGATGDFPIDTTFTEGTYTVRAYTNWMKNDPELFFVKRIPVINTKSNLLPQSLIQPKIDLQFFPEGGSIIVGIMSQIAFKAIDHHGKGIYVEGKIVDEQDNLVTSFKSVHNGMGSFPLIALANKSYQAILQTGEIFPMPVTNKNGMTLTVSNMNESKIMVRIGADKDFESVPAYLIAHSRESIYYASSVHLDRQTIDLSISKDEIPEGVLQLTLFNSDGIPECERMLFIKKDEKMIVSIKSSKEQYFPRDSIILKFKVNDTEENPIETSLSVSVTDASLVNVDQNSENIYTTLLLQSDIKGYVENPGWYFEYQTPERNYALDLVMLTHGWSRYNWSKISNTGADSILFKPEKGITLEGQILIRDKPAANASFVLMIPQSERNDVNIHESDSLGYFRIPDLDFSDSTLISWRVMNKRNVSQNAKIELKTKLDIPPVTQFDERFRNITVSKNDLYQKLLARYIKTDVWSINNSRMLDEVIVTGQRIEVHVLGRMGIVVKPNPTDVQSRVATSQFVTRYAPKLPFIVPRKLDGIDIWVGIMISVDGNVMENAGFGGPQAILDAIPIEDIDHVSVFGSARQGYFITIRTKETSTQDFGTIQQIAKGYDAAREFYHPAYGPSDISNPNPDNRMTLYWNANLQTNKDGIATIKFYNNDIAEKFLISVEGISSGLTISKIQMIGLSE